MSATARAGLCAAAVLLAAASSCEPSDSSAGKWTKQVLDKSNSLYAVWGASVDDVYVFGSGGLILYTRDRGTTWIERPASTTADLVAAWGSGADDIYAVGGSTIVHSTTRGVNWTVSDQPGRTMVSVAGTGASDVYIAADGGNVLHSVDRGLTWSDQQTGAASLRGLWAGGAGQVFAAAAAGQVAHTTDGGASWMLHDVGTTADLTAIWGSSSGDLFVVAAGVGGEAAFFVSHDAGLNWQRRISLKLPNLPDAAIVALWGANSSELFALHSTSWIYHSFDGGVNWDPELIQGELTLGGLWGTSASSVYVVGTQKDPARSFISQKRP